MKLNLPLLHRLVWPEKPSLFVIIGGAVGMAGDMASFFTGVIDLPVLALIFGIIAVSCTLLCLQRAALLKTDSVEEVKAVVECRVCDGMRFGLFATLAFLALLILGQGKTMTETMGEQLGLISRDVAQISSEVEGLSDITRSQKLVAKPSSAEDYFRNAWIYINMHRDPAKAFEAMTGLYKVHAPARLDAADLYYNAGRQVIGRDELLKRMEELGQERRDPSLLVIAARNASTPEETARLQAAARHIDADYPFAYWDIMAASAQMRRTGVEPSQQVAMLTQQVADIETFIRLMGAKPASAYFFLPQYQPDYEVTARQTLGSLQSTLESYRRMDEMRKGAGGR